MSDDTRGTSDGAGGSDRNRTSCSGGVAPVREDLGGEIDRLTTEGRVILALAWPWSESVRAVLDRFEEIVRPLGLGDELHREVGEAAGIAELYEQLDALVLAGSGEVC